MLGINRFYKAKNIFKNKSLQNTNLLKEDLQKGIQTYYNQYSIKVNKKTQYKIKRGIDIGFSSLMLILSSPLMAFSAVALRSESKGPLIFKQVRIGENGKPFVIYKLRSMKANEPKPDVFIRSKDPRVTKVGKFIRKHGIDEFPQFWNILKGDMSLVGPRPWIPNEVNEMKPEHMLRYANKPGLAMVCYSYAKSMPENLRSSLKTSREFSHDENVQIEQNFYQNWNWKKDCKALFYFFRDLIIGRHI